MSSMPHQLVECLLLSIVASLYFSEGFSSLAHGATSSPQLADDCEKELDGFNSLDQFEAFAREFENKSEAQLKKEKLSKICLRDRQAILDLAKLTSRRNQVCDPDKIDELINYHKIYIKTGRFLGKTRAITHKFFTKYAIQVAYTCKKNLLQNLELAREELRARSKVFDEARDRVYHEVPDLKSNIKLIEEQPDDPLSANVKPRDEAELTLGEYREALTKLRRPEDILTFERDDCKDRSAKSRETKVSSDKLQVFFKPALMCHQLHRYYAGSLLSIARLANHGYLAMEPELDAKIAENPMVRDWIVAVQVCDPMLYLGTTEVRDDWATVDTCSPKVLAIEPLVYDDNITELDADLLATMIPKSEATRSQAQKLMKSAFKRMAKTDIRRQLKSGAKIKSIFSKSLSLLATSPDSFGGSNRFATAMGPSGELVDRMVSQSMTKFTVNFKSKDGDPSNLVLVTGKDNEELLESQLSEKESFEVLMKVVNDKPILAQADGEDDNDIDDSVSFSVGATLMSTLAVLAITMTFEWLFFIVMTLAARICHQLYFNFDNLLTFPPKFLSWSDADFAMLSDKIDSLDEDDLFDYDELTPDEKRQRDLLAQVFGRPPPMLYRD